MSSVGNSSPTQHFHLEICFTRRTPRSTMSWMSASCSVHRCHDDDDGTSPMSPEVEEEEAVGEAAMEMAARLER